MKVSNFHQVDPVESSCSNTDKKATFFSTCIDNFSKSEEEQLFFVLVFTMPTRYFNYPLYLEPIFEPILRFWKELFVFFINDAIE